MYSNHKEDVILTQGRNVPRGSRRACLCANGNTYNVNCCNGNLINQGIGKI